MLAVVAVSPGLIYGALAIVHSSSSGVPIAVLPLTDDSNDAQNEWFAGGMTDEIITNLAQLGALRATTQLIDAKSNRHLWADEYESDLINSIIDYYRAGEKNRGGYRIAGLGPTVEKRENCSRENAVGRSCGVRGLWGAR